MTPIFTVQPIPKTVTAMRTMGTTASVDWPRGNIYYWSGLTGNIDLTISNVPTMNNQHYTLVFYLNQGDTGYYINSLTVNSTNVTIKFPSATAPTPTANVLTIQTFRLYYNATWTAVSEFTNFA